MDAQRTGTTFATAMCIAAGLSSCDAGPTQPPLGDLAGAWELLEFGPLGEEAPPLEGTEIDAEFRDERRFIGFGGCNAYGGTFVIEGSNQLRVVSLGSTKVLCLIPAGVSEQESAFFTAMRNASRYDVIEDALEILYDSGAGRLVFARQGQGTSVPGRPAAN